MCLTLAAKSCGDLAGVWAALLHTLQGLFFVVAVRFIYPGLFPPLSWHVFLYNLVINFCFHAPDRSTRLLYPHLGCSKLWLLAHGTCLNFTHPFLLSVIRSSEERATFVRCINLPFHPATPSTRLPYLSVQLVTLPSHCPILLYSTFLCFHALLVMFSRSTQGSSTPPE